MGIALRFIVTAAALPLCGYLMDGVMVGTYRNAIIVGLILAAIYTVLRPVIRLLLKIFNFLTLGLLNVAVDAGLVWLAAGLLPGSVTFESFWWAVAVAVVINAARALVDAITGGYKRKD